MLLQTDDHGPDLARAHPRLETLNFFRDDLVGFSRLIHAAFQILIDHALQIVDVVQEDVVEFVDRRLDVARDGDVDEEHRPVPARLDDLLHLVFAQQIFAERRWT